MSKNIVTDRLRRARRARGMTQTQLAARCGVLGFDIAREAISKIETGRRTVSDLELVLLAKALRISVGKLIPSELPPWQKDVRPPGAEL